MLDRARALRGAAPRVLSVAVVAGVALVLVLRTVVDPSAGETAAAGRVPAGVTPVERLPARPETLADEPLAPITREEARRRNAAVAFAEADPVAALPFRFAGSAVDRARATDCLALAAMAEAGGSEAGQRAVIQVILNRVRHPAFTPTVCGAVFAGSQRETGCQFTFTCDGALGRRYGEGAWTAARQRAREALDGRVYAPVGLATHYHTDWVYPTWSPELAKVARVETHLFFRWPGYWGSRRAMAARYGGNEPAVAALAELDSHAPEAASGEAATGAGGEAVAGARGGGDVVANIQGRAFFIQLDAGASAAGVLARGRDLCPADKANCRVMGWLERAAIPTAYPVPAPSRAQLTFSYAREGGAEIVFYDCRHFPETPRDQCIPPARRG